MGPPQLRYFPAGSEDMYKYDGERLQENLVEYVKGEKWRDSEKILIPGKRQRKIEVVHDEL